MRLSRELLREFEQGGEGVKAIGYILLCWFLYYVGSMESTSIERYRCGIWALRVIVLLAIIAFGVGVYYLIIE